MTPVSERGAALLSVLLLVAVMAVIAATALDRLTLATRLASAAASGDQARAFAYAGEALVLRRADDIAQSRDNGWLVRDYPLPLPGGQATGRLSDATNCFNLNALVAAAGPGRFTQRPLAVEQFADLARLAGINEGEAAAIAAATADWIDSDAIEAPLGAEDEVYRSLTPAYLPANTLMADVSELKAVHGVTAAHYARLRPLICVLPVTDPVQINVNTLRPTEAVLVAALWADSLSLGQVRSVLAARPRGGYGSATRFWQAAPLQGLTPPQDVAEQIVVSPRWIVLTSRVVMGDSELDVRSLIDVRRDRPNAVPQIVARQFGLTD
ncbi:MAG: type II secretion system minor pseudopilin GspK [Sphingopyxis sp.]|nr:type II secretion system minor pseudopilin GspK [Sphingopyxis sp.]